MVRRRVSAKRFVETGNPPSPVGKASDYILHFEELLRARPGLRVVLYCRVSGVTQNRNRNLIAQEAALRRDVEKSGAVVIGCLSEVVSGWVVDAEQQRYALSAAVQLALEHDAVIVADRVNRLVRHRKYHSVKAPDAQPTEYEFSKLQELVNGVELATILHPDASPHVVKSFETERGMVTKGRKGGRPRKKQPGELRQRRLDAVPKVLNMHTLGFTYREIADFHHLPRSTVQRWIKRYG